MTKRQLEQACAPLGATLRDVALVIDRLASSLCMLTDERGRLAGIITDGDLRRALLAGSSLEDPATPHATTTPHVVAAGSSRAHVLDLMRALRVSAVPVVASDGTVVGLHTLSDVIGAEPLPNAAVVMAGGKGTRLGGLTRNVPKPLMTVAGRSILEWIVLNLVGDGVREVWVSVNHLAEQIEEHLGDGSRLGCSVRYLRESPDHPLGTAGSLAMLREQRPGLADPVIVMNGDLLVEFDATALLDVHRRSRAALTMGVRSYQHEVPFGVVTSDAHGRVTSIVEKPTVSFEINAAVYAVEPATLDLLPSGKASTMPWLVQRCLDEGRPVTAWTIATDWLDVGTPTDLARAKGQV